MYICTFPGHFFSLFRNRFILSFFFFLIVARVPKILLGEKSSASALFQRPQHPVRFRTDRRIDRPTTKKRSRGDKGGGGGVQSDRRRKSGSRLRPSGEATVRYKEAKRNRRAATATATAAGCCNNASTAATAATATENTFSAREKRSSSDGIYNGPPTNIADAVTFQSILHFKLSYLFQKRPKTKTGVLRCSRLHKCSIRLSN